MSTSNKDDWEGEIGTLTYIFKNLPNERIGATVAFEKGEPNGVPLLLHHVQGMRAKITPRLRKDHNIVHVHNIHDSLGDLLALFVERTSARATSVFVEKGQGIVSARQQQTPPWCLRMWRRCPILTQLLEWLLFFF
jgi:hypothetical protein